MELINGGPPHGPADTLANATYEKPEPSSPERLVGPRTELGKYGGHAMHHVEFEVATRKDTYSIVAVKVVNLGIREGARKSNLC